MKHRILLHQHHPAAELFNASGCNFAGEATDGAGCVGPLVKTYPLDPSGKFIVCYETWSPKKKVMSKAMLVYQRVTSRTSLTLNFNLIFCLCQMPRYSHQTAGAGSPQISHPDPTCLISAAVTRQSKSIQFTTHHVIVAVQIPHLQHWIRSYWPSSRSAVWGKKTCPYITFNSKQQQKFHTGPIYFQYIRWIMLCWIFVFFSSTQTHP
jgi:hypothetical protein